MPLSQEELIRIKGERWLAAQSELKGGIMSRYFAPISIDEFKKKVEAAFYDEEEGFKHYELKDKLKSDMKVNFDFENFEYPDSHFGPKPVMGYRTLPNGMTLLGMCAGGDWEHPVYFCLYWDGKKIRCYIPTEGNPWNTDTKEAFGNDDEKDLKNAKKRWPEEFKDATEVDSGDFEFDFAAIEKDIMERVQPQPGGAQPAKKKKSSPAPQPSGTQPTKRPSLQERIEALTFYGTGDEAYELFQATCDLCYKMYGLGGTEEAKILCMWAEEQAWATEEDWVQQGGDLNDKTGDVAKGYWGYH